MKHTIAVRTGIASLSVLSLIILLTACSRRHSKSEEQIRIDHSEVSASDTSVNSIRGNLSFSQIASVPHKVVLTGIAEHRLVTVYKTVDEPKENRYRDSYSSFRYYDEYESEREAHFMPGIDLIHGYNLLNIAHYDMTTEKLNYLFDHPVLIKSLYYPSYIQDSLYEKPVNRDYYLVSVYDTDTNQDTLINKQDLRRFYHFNSAGTEKIQLIPNEYSVVRSQYDPRNDVMYIYARNDTDKSGTIEKGEPLHIFWFHLKEPAVAKRLY